MLIKMNKSTQRGNGDPTNMPKTSDSQKSLRICVWDGWGHSLSKLD